MTHSRSWQTAKSGGFVWNVCWWGSLAIVAGSLVGCSSRPIIYPVIVPVYNQPGSMQNTAPQSYQVPPSYPGGGGAYPNNDPYSGQNQGIDPQASTAANSGKAIAVPEGYQPYNQGQMGQPSQVAPSAIGQPMKARTQGMISSRRPGMPFMTEDQRREMYQALFHYSGGAVEAVSKELAEVMQPALEASACGMAWVPELAARNTATEMAKSRAVVPFQDTPGHDTVSSCLNVRQVDNWRVAPPTKVTFRVLFQSPSSNERASRRFEMMRDPSGRWYFQSMNEPF